MEPTPTLVPSTKTLSPISSGKVSFVLNASLRVTVTSSVASSYVKFFALMPLGFPTGMIVGSTFDRLLVFCRISTSFLSKGYLSFTSIISFLVLTNDGKIAIVTSNKRIAEYYANGANNS